MLRNARGEGILRNRKDTVMTYFSHKIMGFGLKILFFDSSR